MCSPGSVLVSMAPLSQEVRSVSSCSPPHLGPPVAEMNSVWFKLWLYHSLHAGPPSLLLAKGARLRTLPAFLKASCCCRDKGWEELEMCCFYFAAVF